MFWLEPFKNTITYDEFMKEVNTSLLNFQSIAFPILKLTGFEEWRAQYKKIFWRQKRNNAIQATEIFSKKHDIPIYHNIKTLPKI